MKKVILIIAILCIPLIVFGQSAVTDLTELGEEPATGDWFMVVDVSDTTMSANGTNKKMQAQYVGGGGAQYLTLAANSLLTNERVFTLGDGFDGTDGGAGGNYTIDLDLTELTGNKTWNDGSTDASFTWTFNLNAGTDPVITYSDDNVDWNTPHSASTYTADPSATPGFTGYDSDVSNDDVFKIYGNANDANDAYMYGQVEEGNALVTYWTADGVNEVFEMHPAPVFSDTIETFTTEGDITDPLPSGMILLDGDNDSDNDAIDLQDGAVAGQQVLFVASADIDSNDTCTINMGDTTCTNCPTVAFDKIGENALMAWTGTTWVVISLQSSL